MIKFSAKMKVISLTDKEIKKKDGGTFAFTEVRLEQGGKYNTVIVARLDSEARGELTPGSVYELDLGINSFETTDGRVFNNFIIKDIVDKVEPCKTPVTKPQPTEFGDDIPF